MHINYNTSKRIVILGASSGIGLALAKVLTEDGHHVAIAARREEKLKEMNLPYEVIDITKTEKVPTLLQQLINKISGMDLFILCSGAGNSNRKLDPSIELATNQVNVLGFTTAIDWAFNYFKTQGYGHIVGITSITGLRGVAEAPSYSASKAYQIHYLEALHAIAAKEKRNIIVTDICPGFCDTAMGQNKRAFWVAPTTKAAKQIVNAIYKRKKRAFITKRWRLITWIIPRIPYSIYKLI